MYSDPWAIPSLIIACIGVLCVAATAVIFGVYWKTPVIKSSGREQMILLLIGICCSFILPFFYVAPPSIPICLVNRLGIWFCYSLMFAALAVKAQRVARIFYGVKRNIHYKPRFATPIYQVIFTLIIVAIQMIPI
ncbi:Metabotropic glutamate receptor 5, partial [Geodia barretti]